MDWPLVIVLSMLILGSVSKLLFSPLTVALITLGVLCLLGAMSWWLVRHISHKLIYKPTRTNSSKPHSLDDDISSEIVWFETSDGIKLHGWYCAREANNAVMLICHGNKGSIAEREDTVTFYMRLGINVFIFDYRGYGCSAGKTSAHGTEQDVLAAWRYLREQKNIAANDIVLMGRSLGGAVAAQLAQHKTPGAVVIESTFSSIRAIAQEIYPKLKRFLSHHVAYDTLEKISRVSSPLLLVHSKEDELIGYHHAEALLAAAPKGAELLAISGRHSDGFYTSREQYVPAVTAFLLKNRIKLNRSDASIDDTLTDHATHAPSVPTPSI